MYFIFQSDCRSKIKEKQTYIIQYETELQTVKFKHDSLSVNRMFTVKKKMDSLKKEVGYSLTILVDRVNVNIKSYYTCRIETSLLYETFKYRKHMIFDTIDTYKHKISNTGQRVEMRRTKVK